MAAQTTRPSGEVAVPHTGVDYPIVLGSSLNGVSEHEFATMRFNFRPNTVSRERTGTLELQQDVALNRQMPVKVRLACTLSMNHSYRHLRDKCVHYF